MEVATRGKVPESLRYRWLFEIAQAIEYIHSEGIVHDHFEASNCLLDSALHVKVRMILFPFCPPRIETCHNFEISFLFNLK